VKVVGASDASGGMHRPDGLDVRALAEHVAAGGGVSTFEGGDALSNAELLALDVDLLLPCAREDVLTAENAAAVRASVVVEGANGPTTPEADRLLADRAIVVPDILANAGGVVASYVEWRMAKSGSLTTIDETFALVDERIENAFSRMLEWAGRTGLDLRQTCMAIAVDELVNAMRDREWI
jgi:glutamate dehydrogenase (NAD(P)+)